MVDEEAVYAAMRSRDPRFDGWFYVAVTTTGIYCRPSCPAVMPHRRNVRLFPTAAAAQVNGFRACKRCRPDAAPGSPEWNARGDLVARAMRLIADGLVDREGVAGLAARLGYSERHLHRLLTAEVGAGPQALARAQRAQTARTLLGCTDLPVSDVAFAAGFASIRQFNDTIRQIYATTPTRLRQSGRPDHLPHAPGVIALRLPYRPPMDVPALLRRLGRDAVPGIEEYTEGTYRRSLRLPHGTGVVALRHVPSAPYVACEIRLEDVRDLTAAVRRCRRLLDLDADQRAIDAFLGADPVLGPLVAARPGLRVPGHPDPAELAVRTVLSRRVPAERARARLSDLVAAHGRPLVIPVGQVTHTFPDLPALACWARQPPCAPNPDSRIPQAPHTAPASSLPRTAPGPGPTAPTSWGPQAPHDPDPAAAASWDARRTQDPATTASLIPVPQAARGSGPRCAEGRGAGAAERARTFLALVEALEKGEVVLDAGADPREVREGLLGLPGLGSRAAALVLMRAFGDPDVFIPDLAVRRALHRLGARPGRWSPWGSYATQHLREVTTR
ncbi:DNA-3-methyladenine glycosylase 2 family protein [Nonomuraea aridisoli]|uniref:DNA-3-methyladenine glycosylase 2 family protein n=1 Tax=Nonomuraea aridisoli TaxID=2070368 RepID=UPI001F295A98|nr:DNA-3-methyladenine glycosylase 2 family protein [Nonomuraea aridisoli]